MVVPGSGYTGRSRRIVVDWQSVGRGGRRVGGARPRRGREELVSQPGPARRNERSAARGGGGGVGGGRTRGDNEQTQNFLNLAT